MTILHEYHVKVLDNKEKRWNRYRKGMKMEEKKGQLLVIGSGIIGFNNACVKHVVNKVLKG